MSDLMGAARAKKKSLTPPPSPQSTLVDQASGVLGSTRRVGGQAEVGGQPQSMFSPTSIAPAPTPMPAQPAPAPMIPQTPTPVMPALPALPQMPSLQSPPPPPNFTNTAPANPMYADLQKQHGDLMGELSGKTDRAKQVTEGRIRDAYEGRRTAISADAARRGISGSGAEASLIKESDQQAQRDINASNVDLELGKYNQLRAGIDSGVNLAKAPGDESRAERGLGLDQWQAQNQASMAHNAAQMDQVRTTWDQMMSLRNAYRESPAFTPPQMTPVMQPQPVYPASAIPSSGGSNPLGARMYKGAAHA